MPHGNSTKSNKPFLGTLPSTMAMIKKECNKIGPKRVIEKVSSQLGGMVSASICELPRSEQQVSQAKRRSKRSDSCRIVNNPDDELAVVMQKAFMEDTSQHFIRQLRTLREPAIVVAQDQQILDLVRFCTLEHEFGIMTVDPTFSLGEFDVTITTYRHLLLECRRSGNSPVFIGPSLIHYKKSFSTYLFFASTLVGTEPELSHLRSFGTDGEQALFEAFQHEFPESIHLQCFNHVHRNIKAKLQERMSVSQPFTQVILGDIFGRMVDMKQFDGLVDAEDEEEYENGVQSLCEKWENYDSSENGPIHLFCRWLKTYKSNTIKQSMLRSKRRQCGLGDPPSSFTTNASESINAVVKNRVDYKKSDVPVFLDNLKAVIDEQQRELERAIVDKGKYRFRQRFKGLVKTEDEWFLRMSSAQRQNHIKRISNMSLQSKKSKPDKSVPASAIPSTSMGVKSCARRQLFRSVSEAPSSSTAYMRSPESSEPPPAVQGGVLSVSVQSFCGSVVIPEHVLDAIWKKAADLTKEQAAILQAPGGTGFLVKSNSNPRPHFITVKRSGQYCCDSECPNWKSLCMCAHSVAVAEKEGDLERFIEWFKQAKKAPNLTKLVTTKMPKGRGHKGGVAPSKKKRKVTSAERIPFTAVCGMSNSQNSASTSPLNPEESTSHVNQPQSSNVPMEGHLSHTLTTSSGSRSQAVASDFYISHHVSLPSGRAASQGYVSEGCSMPSVPPPLISCSSASPS